MNNSRESDKLIMLALIVGTIGLSSARLLAQTGADPVPVKVKSLLEASARQASGDSIRLRTGTLDTSPAVEAFRKSGSYREKLEKDIDVRLKSLPSGKPAPLIVQLAGPIQERDKQLLSKTVAAIHDYLPDNAFLVEASPDQVDGIASLGCVRWVGYYKPEYKIQPGLCSEAPGVNQKPERSQDGLMTVTIVTFSSDDVDPVSVQVVRSGGVMISSAPGLRKGTIQARVSASSVVSIAALPEVEWIERHVPPRFFNNIAREAPRMNTDRVHADYGLTGRGQVLCVCDTGLDTGDTATLHPDFTNRVRAAFGWTRSGAWSDIMGHGTHCAGSVLGNGSAYSNGLFKGVAYEAELVFQSVGDASNELYLPGDLNEIFIQAYTNGARVHSDSWGSSEAGAYTVECRQSDEFVWNHPDMLIVFSAGNEGIDADRDGIIDSGSLGAPASAKNVLAVGAACSDRPSGSGGYSSYRWGELWGVDYPASPVREGPVSAPWDGVHQGMAAFSSRGPCQDGRVKPEVVSPGTDIVSCRSRMPGARTLWGTGSGVLANAASNFYTFCGGTSMSTPLTAGAAGLVRQYFADTRGWTNPSAALVKAALAAGARSLAPGQYGATRYREVPSSARPNNVEGWGHVDLGNALFPQGGRTNVFYDDRLLNTGNIDTYSFLSDSSNRVCIMLAWSDYPSSSAAAAALVNDLDLLVSAPDGALYYPNGSSGFDRTNNMEGIEIYPSATGVYTIMVIGHNVPYGPQPYALMIHESAADNQAIEGIWHEPYLVTNQASASVKAIVAFNGSGLAAVSHFYRVNGGSWSSQAMSAPQALSVRRTFAAAIPGQEVGAVVDYYVCAYAQDGSLSISATNSYHVQSGTIYVSKRGIARSPYDTIETAFTNIQAAVDYADEGTLVLVDSGTYGSETIRIYKPLTLRSINGADQTLLDGETIRQCVSNSANALVDGFTIQRGRSVVGGGVYLHLGEIRNCVIVSNAADMNAGGAVIDTVGRVRDCVISHNTADQMGGGLATSSGGDADRCVISDNTAEIGGGVALMFDGHLTNCLIQGNQAGTNGGGVLMAGMLGPGGEAANCLVVSNSAVYEGGGVYLLMGGKLYNCTISANDAPEGGGIYCGLGRQTICNSIVYGNTASNYTNDNTVTVAYSHCCITPAIVTTSLVMAEAVIDTDPLFVNPAAGDYRLRIGSPCRDAGSNLTWMTTDSVDFAGRPRIVNGIVDMGAYELSVRSPKAVKNDYNGDGASDFAVYDRSTGYWYIQSPVTQRTIAWQVQWGWSEASLLAGDFDGDGVNDLTAYDRSAGNWYIRSINSDIPGWAYHWGWSGAVPVSGDYNGDGMSDLAVYNTMSGLWYIYNLYSNSIIAWAEQFGYAGTTPIPGDYDGDHVDDLAVFDPTTGDWYVRSLSGTVIAWQTRWGWPGAMPVTGDYDGDGVSDLAVYDRSAGQWYVQSSYDHAAIVWADQWGFGEVIPVAGDYDGDGLNDLAVFDPATGDWYVRSLSGTVIAWQARWGWPGAVIVE